MKLEVARALEFPAAADGAAVVISGRETINEAPGRLDRAFDQISRTLAPDHPTRVTVVRYASLDAIGHYYLRYAMPSEFGDVTDDERRRLGLVLESHYSFIDAAIGRAIAALGPDDLLLIVSGYGMEPLGFGKRLLEVMIGDPGLSGTHEGAPDGFLMAYGPSVARSRLLARGSVVDFVPTLLYFLGLPIGRDMDGFARTDLFQRAYTDERPLRSSRPTTDRRTGRAAHALYCFALFNAALRGREEVNVCCPRCGPGGPQPCANRARNPRTQPQYRRSRPGRHSHPGVPLAKRIAKSIQDVSGHEVPTGALDITLYRDDLMRTPLGPQPVVRKTESSSRSTTNAFCSWTTFSTRAGRSGPRSMRSSTSGVRERSSSSSSWIVDTASFRSSGLRGQEPPDIGGAERAGAPGRDRRTR